jgi:hypothetical protein
MQNRELDGQGLPGRQTVFIAQAFFFLTTVGGFKEKHI